MGRRRRSIVAMGVTVVVDRGRRSMVSHPAVMVERRK
jgi:hypothetical protein